MVNIILIPLIEVFSIVLVMLRWGIIVYAILSWLLFFNVVNPGNQFIYFIGNFLSRLYEPLVKPIRRFIPNLGGIDLSLMILFLILLFFEIALRQFIRTYMI